MTPEANAAVLCGLVNPIDVAPAFAIPVFQWEGGGNDLLVQIVGKDGRVEGFTRVEVGCYGVHQDVETVRLEIGQPALWAFQWDAARWLVASREALSGELARYRESASLAPLLDLAIARFLSRGTADGAVVRRAFDHLSHHSPESAALWRDLIVLLPAARMEIQRALPQRTKAAQRAIDDVTLACEDRLLRVRVPSQIVSAFGSDKHQLLGALNAMRSLTDPFDVDRIEIIEIPDGRQRALGSESDSKPRPLVVLVPLSQIGGSLASAAGKHSRLRAVDLEDLLPEGRSKLSPNIDARARDVFLILLSDKPDEVADAERLASSLVGRGCLAAAIIVRPYHGASSSEGATSDRRFDKLARMARWVAIIGGPQSSGHALQPLVEGAEPSRNSPTHIGKWVVRAFLAAVQDPQAGREALDLAFRGARGPKFATLGVGSASGATAIRIAVDAAYASAKGSLLDPNSARSVAAFLIRGPGASSDARQQCIDHIKRNARPETVISVHETVLPTLKNRARVVLIARGFPTNSFSWTPPAYLEALRDHGCSYTRLREQGENLDLEMWQGSAEFGVIVDIERRLANR